MQNEVQAKIAALLAKAQVQVVSQTIVRPRNEKGHFIAGAAYDRLVIDGHGVDAPIRRAYFRTNRLPRFAAAGITADLPRVKRSSGEIVLKIQRA